MIPDDTHILSELVARVAKVRKRLVSLIVLRSLAMIFFSVSIYILLFAWLDHRNHFGTVTRCVSLLILIVITVGLLLAFMRNMCISFGLEHAASRIETARHYRQQLLAAVEYYQQQEDYPYSKPLARRMVRQFWNEVWDDDFSSTVAVWKLWVCAAVIMIGLVLMGLFMRYNYAYLARYAGRLGRPTAALDPLPATRLKSLSGDILAEPNEVVVMEAAIEGRLPQKGKLVIEKQTKAQHGAAAETNALIGQVYDPHKALTLQPVEDVNDDNPVFRGKCSFEKTGLYRYRFTAAGSESQWQSVRICTFPEIEKITTRISFDAGSHRFTTTETVSDFVLSALAGSKAEITVEANCKLETAEVKHLDNSEEIRSVNGSESFTFDTSIDREGHIGFRLQDTDGLWSRELPPLTVKIEEDEQPKFSLLHPEGDGLATNVASVPIQFEIKDDFGITDANLVLEIGDGHIERISATISEDTRIAKIDHVLELEKYGLQVGDAILFYASAEDVTTGSTPRSRPARSDVMILEIKPYRRIWVQCSDGSACPCGPMQQQDPALIHDRLIEILEYTRAFLKKTWRLANQDRPGESDRTKHVAIADDIEYASENLELIRDDPRYGFDGTDIEAINGVLDDFELARTELLADRVENAIPPETRAYRALRRLVDDIIQGDPKGGNATNKDKPDKVELKDVQHLTRLERARVAWQLKTLNQQLAEVAKEQETLNRTFLHFLDEKPKQERRAKVNDEKSWVTATPPSHQAAQQSPQGSVGRGRKQDRTIEGALASASGVMSGPMPANFTEIMRVLRAQQKQLRTELSMLEEQLAQIPIGLNKDSNKSDPIEARKEAKAHIEQAKSAMDRFEAFLAEQYYEQHDPNQLALEAPAMLGAISRELMMARQAMQQEVASYMDDDAERLRQMALNLQEMTNAYDKALTPEQRRQLLNNMAAATAQLNSMSSIGPPDNTNVGGDRSGRATGPVLVVKSDYQDIVDAARFTARHFLSKDMEVTRRSGARVGSADGGSLKFYEQENDFFESAAENRPK